MTTAGTTGAVEPTWTKTIGATTNDGTVVWQCTSENYNMPCEFNRYDGVVITGCQQLMNFGGAANGSDVTNNEFNGIWGIFWGSAAFTFAMADNNRFDHLYCFPRADARFDVTTQLGQVYYSMDFKADARANYVKHLVGGISVVRARTPSVADWHNTIEDYDRGNNTGSPIIDAGARIEWREASHGATGWYLRSPISLNPKTETYTPPAGGAGVAYTSYAVPVAMHQVRARQSMGTIAGVSYPELPASRHEPWGAGQTVNTDEWTDPSNTVQFAVTKDGYPVIGAGGTPPAKVVSVTASVVIGNVAGQSCKSLNIGGFTGLTLSDDVRLTPDGILDVNEDLSWSARVLSSTTVRLLVCNPTTGTINGNTVTWRATVTQF